ncbi:hypothetical protein AURDEDRAFT_114819 [Auricularia subglabra TFB-10046 SS5]|nr:hypothetical protein AURDEDRAFT_114819 [Auricularia subglabra TFB-10046 SS5]
MKSALVLHILYWRLCKSGKLGTSLGLSRMLPTLFMSVTSGEMPNYTLSTNVFFKTARAQGVQLRRGVDLRKQLPASARVCASTQQEAHNRRHHHAAALARVEAFNLSGP